MSKFCAEATTVGGLSSVSRRSSAKQSEHCLRSLRCQPTGTGEISGLLISDRQANTLLKTANNVPASSTTRQPSPGKINRVNFFVFRAKLSYARRRENSLKTFVFRRKADCVPRTKNKRKKRKRYARIRFRVCTSR